MDDERQGRLAPADGRHGDAGAGGRGGLGGAVQAGVGGGPGKPDQQAQARVAEDLPQHALDALGGGPAVVEELREGLDALHGAGAVAVEAPVNRPLEPASQGVERERHGDRGHCRPGRRSAAERLGHQEGEPHGRGGEHQRQRHPRDRPADDPVNVVEPVTQHGHDDRRDEADVDRDEREEGRAAPARR